ncbi:acyl-CoA N-acyltransferase [Cubamyces sp. BRFM 1775]|nr:acyl-CoA N-acyltransferase [Cubamyces sp. BRFM 1775]
MSKPQYHPLQFHPITGEPFLRLPSPHDNIIITPPRMSDAETIVSYMNDPALYYWLEGPPFPYLREHADDWLKKVKGGTDAAIAELERANAEHPDGPPVIVSSCPLRCLREVREDGSDVFLGDVTLLRERWPDLEDKELKESLAKPNAERPIGDPGIVWCIGDYIAPSHHGKGIMTAAIKTLMQEWAIPRMGVRQIRVETFTDNIGSRRVFEKLGFVYEKTNPLQSRFLNSGRRIDGMDILWWKAE